MYTQIQIKSAMPCPLSLREWLHSGSPCVAQTFCKNSQWIQWKKWMLDIQRKASSGCAHTMSLSHSLGIFTFELPAKQPCSDSHHRDSNNPQSNWDIIYNPATWMPLPTFPNPSNFMCVAFICKGEMCLMGLGCPWEHEHFTDIKPNFHHQ